MKKALFALLLAALLLVPTLAYANPCPWGPPGGQMDELVSGRDLTQVGWVFTWIADGYFHVKIVAPYGGWLLKECHVQLAADLSGVPQTSKGNPVIGAFMIGEEFDTPLTEWSCQIPVSQLPPGNFVVAAHAVVDNGCSSETAWGTGCYADTYAFPGSSWARYFRWNAGTWD